MEEQRKKPGFMRAALRDLCKNMEYTNPRRCPDEKFTYISISSIDKLCKRIVKSESVYGRTSPENASRVIRENDVLFVTNRPYNNAVALVPRELDGAVCCNPICVLRPGPAVDPEYLYYWVRKSRFIKELSCISSANKRPHVTDEDIFSQIVTLPESIAEQKRIVGIIKEKLDWIDRVGGYMEDQLNAFGSLSSSILFTTFNGRPREALRLLTGYLKDTGHRKIGPGVMGTWDLNEKIEAACAAVKLLAVSEHVRKCADEQKEALNALPPILIEEVFYLMEGGCTDMEKQKRSAVTVKKEDTSALNEKTAEELFLFIEDKQREILQAIAKLKEMKD